MASKKKTGRKKKSDLKVVNVKRPPRQGRLKGMEDNAIQDLEDAAVQHSELRSEATASRADFKQRLDAGQAELVALMKKNGKTKYNHAGIRLKLREGVNSVSVQVKRHDAESKPSA